MRDLNVPSLNQFRFKLWGEIGDENHGHFKIPSPIDGAVLAVIASNDMGWDHVSVSRRNRCPNWTEMSHIAALFFKDDETAFQLHVPASEHINLMPNCLHWWRPHNEAIPKPPQEFVGVPGDMEENLKHLKARIKELNGP